MVVLLMLNVLRVLRVSICNAARDRHVALGFGDDAACDDAQIGGIAAATRILAASDQGFSAET